MLLLIKLHRANIALNLFIAPGNPGTAQFGENITISATDFPAIKNFVLTMR
jgi:phosphoribosylamine--glycine ligase